MKSLDVFLSQIFISLENFLQKSTTLNIFEALIFNYKIKVNSIDQFPPQFIAFVADLCNELQLILHENTSLDTEKNDTAENQNSIFCDLPPENTGFEVSDYTASLASFQASEQSNKEVWEQKEIQSNGEIRERTPSPLSQDKENAKYTCNFCNKKYQTSETLSKHFCKLTPINDERTEDYVANSDSSQPGQLCLPEPPSQPPITELPVYVCAACFSAFRQKEMFDQHTHTDSSQGIELMKDNVQLQSQRKFSCGVCREVYRSLARISYHVARCHSGPYQCELCPHTVATKQLLNHHKKKNHKGVESFFCAECGLGFKLRTSLQKHIVKRHENEQDHFCCQEEGCGQFFSKKIQLTNHRIAVHGAERKFLCQVCGNKFMTQESLTSHLEAHTNNKKFRCKFCDKLFNAKEKLIFHVRTHTGEKPFACDKVNCQKSFVSKAKLMDHLQRHRGEKRHKCSICGKQYANKPDLQSHIRKVHSLIGPPIPPEVPVAPKDFQQDMEVYPSQVILQVDHPTHSNNQLFNNVQFYQEPVQVVRTVTVPVITGYESVIGM